MLPITSFQASFEKSDMTLQTLFQQLNTEMCSRQFFTENPLIKRIQTDTSVQATHALKQAICQYVRLPEEIVSYLQAAAAWFPKNHPIYCELERNWNQEEGSATGGVAHVQILKYRIQQDLHIDASQVKSNSSTHQFLKSLETGMRRNRWFAIGQAYALEATAVPELAILVGPAINAYAQRTHKMEVIDTNALHSQRLNVLPSKIDTRDQAYTLTMTDWFALHVLDFEVGHRDFLQEKISLSLTTAEDIDQFRLGFTHVLDAMDLWWNGIHE